MQPPAIAWKLPIGTVGVSAGFVAGVFGAYYAGFSSSAVVLSSALGIGAAAGIAALALESRFRATLGRRHQWAWLLGLWVSAALSLSYLIKSMS